MYRKRNKTGAAPIKLLSCRECESTIVNKNDYIIYDYKEVEDFSWALMISCPNNAHQPFYICTECKDQRFQMIKRRQMQRHHRMYHINIGTNSTTSDNGAVVKELNNVVLMNNIHEDHTAAIDICNENFTMIGNEDQSEEKDIVSKAYPVKKENQVLIAKSQKCNELEKIEEIGIQDKSSAKEENDGGSSNGKNSRNNNLSVGGLDPQNIFFSFKSQTMNGRK